MSAAVALLCLLIARIAVGQVTDSSTPALANAITLARQGRYLEAEQIMKQLTDAQPNNANLQLAEGQLYYQFGYYDSALIPLSKTLELRPEDQVAQILKAVCLFKIGDSKNAVELTKHLLAETHPPTYIDLTLTYAQYLFEQGDIEGALTQTRTAVQFAPQHPIGYYWLARLLLQKNDVKGAQDAAERSLQLAPQLPYARNLLVRIYRMEGKTDASDEQAAWLKEYEARKATQQ